MILLTAADVQTAQTIFKLLKSSTSLAVVRDFLRANDLPISASNWDELYSKRIEPALNEGTLTLINLRELLRQVEECGRQHIFLYQCTPERAIQMLSSQRVEAVAEEMGLSGLFAKPLDLDLPDDPSIVDIRLITNENNQPLSLIIKQVETRTTNTFLNVVHDEDKQQMSRVYTVTKKRAVNVAHLYADGLLEIRIASQDNSTKYHHNVSTFFNSIAPLILKDEFHEVSLSSAKGRLLNEQEDLAEVIRFGNSEATNDSGFKVNVFSSSQNDDIFGDDGSKKSLKAFLENGGHVSRTNLYFLIPETEPKRELHVLISGAHNEFAIPVSCTAEDYQYVCGKIRQFNY